MAATGLAATTGLSGCAGLLGGGGGPKAAIRTTFNAAESGDVEQYRSVLHSESPIRPVSEDQLQYGPGGAGSVSITIDSMEVTTRDPSESTITDTFGGLAVPESEVQALVQIVENASESAVVSTSLTVTVSANGEQQSQSTTIPILTATEDGSWTVVASGMPTG